MLFEFGNAFFNVVQILGEDLDVLGERIINLVDLGVQIQIHLGHFPLHLPHFLPHVHKAGRKLSEAGVIERSLVTHEFSLFTHEFPFLPDNL